MATLHPALPPNPSLVAILLVIRMHASPPRLVFHYPPTPNVSNITQTAPPAHASWYGGASTGADGDESSTEQSSDSDEDRSLAGSHLGSDTDREEEKRSKTGSLRSKRDGSKQHTGASTRPPGGRRDIDVELEAGSGDEDEDNVLAGDHTSGRNIDATGTYQPDWDRVFGFDGDALSKLLTPNQAFNKRRFEIGIDNLVFVGSPMFIKDDGTWKKQRQQHKGTGKKPQPPGQDEIAKKDHVDQHGNQAGESEPVSRGNDSNAEYELPPGFEAAYGHGLMSGAASALTSGAASEVASLSEADNYLTMFHVIFAMNPPALEYHTRVDGMYEHVARKMARFLRHEQAHRNFVRDEAIKILSMKEKAKETRTPAYILWPNLAGSSPLARSIEHVFDALSDSKIAHISFDKSIEVAFQIPQPEFTPFVSTATEPQVPGLWLTTTPFADAEDGDALFNPHSALLLLEDEETLVKEIENDFKELASPLIWFVRNLTPTKSLEKQFNKPSAALLFKDSLFLARQLIYLRRARAIPPLHYRVTYIVSPNADMRALSAAVSAFAARFPMLPPLPKILHMLSGPPRPYYTLIPSKDHRPAYMEVLAWLMRGGWITQLKSFGWVSVPARVKQEVAKSITEETKLRKQSHGASEAEHASAPLAPVGYGSAEGRLRISSTESPNSSSATSPHIAPYRSPSHPASDAGSISSERTTVPYRPMSPSPPQQHKLPMRPSPLHMEQQQSPDIDKPEPSLSVGSTRSASVKGIAATDGDMFTPSIIQSPQKANALESRWIEHIGSSFSDPELAEKWPTMLKYLDGKHALDEIALREGLKRKTVASVVLRLRDAGFLLTVRHW